MSTLLIENLPLLMGLLIITLLQGLTYAAQRSILHLHYLVFTKGENDKMPTDSMFKEIMTKAEKVVRTLKNTHTFLNICYGIMLYPFILTPSIYSNPYQATAAIALTLILISFYYILGYTLPGFIAIKYPETILHFMTPVLYGTRKLITPIFALTNFITKRTLLKWLKIQPQKNIEIIDEDVQIRALSKDNQVITETVRSIFHNAKRMSELEVSDILMPRSQVQYFDINQPVEINLEIAKKTGHTRFPLCINELDNVIGIIHIKDIFRFREDPSKINLENLARHSLKFKLDESLENALAKFLKYQGHMAQVVNEFDGTVGFITLEDVLEELVGEIQDEFDADETPIREVRPNTYKMSGLTAIHDLEEILKIEINDDNASTISGLVTAKLGRIPRKGEKVNIVGLSIAIDEVDKRRIISMTITKNKSS